MQKKYFNIKLNKIFLQFILDKNKNIFIVYLLNKIFYIYDPIIQKRLYL